MSRVSNERLAEIHAERPHLVIQDDEFQQLAMDLTDSRRGIEALETWKAGAEKVVDVTGTQLQACRAERAELLAALTGCVYALGIAEKRMGMDSGVLGHARALLEKLERRPE